MKFKTLAFAMTATVASFSAAAETPYGDLITNTASLNYSVAGGVTVTATPAKADFKVDRLVKFNLTTANTAIDAPVGEETAIGFTLTNFSNAAIDYSLPTLDDVTYYIDTNRDGVLDDSEKDNANKVTSISLTQNDGTSSNHIFNYIAVYLPQQGVDGETTDVLFTATAVENDSTQGTVGSAIVPTAATAVWTKDTVQTVAETDADGNFITTQPKTVTFTFVGANIALTKAVRVVNDPISRAETGAVPAGYVAKAIPGAILEYAITVTNSGAKDATLALTDTMPGIFKEDDIDATSYKQSVNGATATDISASVNVATDGSNIVTITFPSATATAKDASNVNGTVVTTFEVKLP